MRFQSYDLFKKNMKQVYMLWIIILNFYVPLGLNFKEGIFILRPHDKTRLQWNNVI